MTSGGRAALCAEPGQRLDFAADLFLGGAQVVESLKAEPELRAILEEVAAPQRRVGCDGALPFQDCRDPVCRYAQMPAEFGCTHLKRIDLLGEVLTWMNPAESRVPRSSLVVNNVHVDRPRGFVGPATAPVLLTVGENSGA